MIDGTDILFCSPALAGGTILIKDRRQGFFSANFLVVSHKARGFFTAIQVDSTKIDQAG
ncbi:MAG: hypothetical protein IIX90_03755 [Clostridia bacterium]|nr:hypothetical protein [Clostridia bacterium]